MLGVGQPQAVQRQRAWVNRAMGERPADAVRRSWCAVITIDEIVSLSRPAALVHAVRRHAVTPSRRHAVPSPRLAAFALDRAARRRASPGPPNRRPVVGVKQHHRARRGDGSDRRRSPFRVDHRQSVVRGIVTRSSWHSQPLLSELLDFRSAVWTPNDLSRFSQRYAASVRPDRLPSAPCSASGCGGWRGCRGYRAIGRGPCKPARASRRTPWRPRWRPQRRRSAPRSSAGGRRTRRPASPATRSGSA